MRILWMSNAPWSPTGYGNQTGLFVPRIAALGHDVAVHAFYGLQGRALDSGGIRIYPNAYHLYGQDVVGAHAQDWGADVIISLMDAWVCQPELYGKTPWCPWYPVDSDPLARQIRERVARARRRIVFSRYGERVTREAGLDCDYIPHGVDTEVFAPRPTDEARARFGLPQDAFVVGMVAANKGYPPRKAFPQHLLAFADLARRHSDAFLLLHSFPAQHGEDGGIDLLELADACGVRRDRMRITDPYQYVRGVPDEIMALMYSAMDVHMLATMGEGFGIPTVEAQACGTPVIVGDWTASGELCFSGWKIPQSEAVPWWTPLGNWQYLVRPGALAEALERAYNMRGNQDYRRRARDGALRYDADKVAEKYWRPWLDKLAAEIGADNDSDRQRAESKA